MRGKSLALFAIATMATMFADTLLAQNSRSRAVSAPAPLVLQTVKGPPTQVIIGDDDRVPSNDRRSGRLLLGLNTLSSACTGFLISNGAVLTAGHCMTLKVQTAQADCPPNSATLVGELQFDVPLSSDTGAVNMPPAQDIYPLDVSSISCRYQLLSEDPVGMSDWAVFAVKPNSNGQLPHPTQGFYRVSKPPPLGTASLGIRITGYGTDGPPPLYGEGTSSKKSKFNYTQQTGVGQFSALRDTDSYSNIDYLTDTTEGTSGAAVLLNGTRVSVGINSGSKTGNTTGPKDFNFGTTFDDSGLVVALQQFPGKASRVPSRNIFYVDAYALGFLESPIGNLFFPFPNLSAALVKVGALSAGTASIVSIVKGDYVELINQTDSKIENITITPPGDLTLMMPVGDVTIWSSVQSAE